jgi:hypothetical protein
MAKRTDVSIESKKFSVTPGDTVHTIANVINSGDTLGQFTFRIEGLDSDWYNLPVSSTTLFPNDEEKLTVSLHPPRTERTKPGLYPFSLVIDSQENPDDTEQVALTLEVRDIPELQFELVPQQITGKKGIYKVVASNPGDRAAGAQLRVTDYDRIMRYNLQPAEISVPGGGSAEATLEVKLRWQHFFHGNKEYSFTILAEEPGSGKVNSLNGKLLKKQSKVRMPFKISTPTRIRPQQLPPDISRFEAITEDKRRYKLIWTVEHASEVMLDDEMTESQGTLEVNPVEVTSYTLTANNKRGTVSRTVVVEPLPVPKEKFSDRILVLMVPNSLSVNAGSEPVEANVEIQNIGSIVDKFSLEIEGIPRSWYSLSVPMVALMPHAKDSIQISFHPPKTEGVISDKYLFAVKVSSQSLPDDCASVTGHLEILPSVNYSVSLKPYRILCRRKCTFQVQIANKDVTEAGLFIDVIDTENGLRFKLESDSPVIPPWQTVNVPMLVRPKRNSLIGDIKRYDISLTATTAEGLIQLARCQMDHKPFLSSWRPIFRTIKYVVIIGVAGFAIYYIIRMGGGWSSLVRDPQAWIDGTFRHIRGWFY